MSSNDCSNPQCSYGKIPAKVIGGTEAPCGRCGGTGEADPAMKAQRAAEKDAKERKKSWW